MEIHVISEGQLAAFKKDGYIVLDNLFTTEDVTKMSGWVDEISAWPTRHGQHLNYYETVDGRKILGRTENFLPYHPDFKRFIGKSKVFSLLEQLLGELPFLFKEKINYKFPGTGKYNPHQDVHAFDKSQLAFQPYHLNCAVFVDEATRENGCFELVPGYEGILLDRNPDGSIVKEISDRLPWIEIPAKPGTTLVFNVWVPHKSEKNMSSKSRRALYFTFNGASKRNLRQAHFEDRAYRRGQTREISPDLIAETIPKPK
jgi:ectoine hydroxylase-related dioxygenase (phytanoyl-CoA dioxygenase family)